MNKEQLINRISSSIHKNDPNAVAYLYGARARGDFGENSDWDLLILVNDKKVTNETEDKFRDDLYDIELDSGQVISILIYPKDYWNSTMVITPLFDNISKDGLKI